jgi:hypothetical protein
LQRQARTKVLEKRRIKVSKRQMLLYLADQFHGQPMMDGGGAAAVPTASMDAGRANGQQQPPARAPVLVPSGAHTSQAPPSPGRAAGSGTGTGDSPLSGQVTQSGEVSRGRGKPGFLYAGLRPPKPQAVSAPPVPDGDYAYTRQARSLGCMTCPEEDPVTTAMRRMRLYHHHLRHIIMILIGALD